MTDAHPLPDPVVAIQVGAVSFADEGIETVLDQMQTRGEVNTLFLATPTWVRGTGGRQVPGHPLPDHGIQEYDHDFIGGNYATPHPRYYGATMLGPVPRAPEHPGFDLLGDVIPAARERGIASYAWMEESGYVQALRDIPNFPKVLETDVWGRPSARPCFNNPDYRTWWLSLVEDYVKSYPIDGLAWCSERPGPLNTTLAGPMTARGISCFCQHCQALGRDRGIDPERARNGYRELLSWNQTVTSGERPGDGAFTTFWRVLLRYPEILAWQQLWTDSQRQLYRDIYGVAKACDPNVEVGWHLFHDLSFSPFYRADQDYAVLGELSDFIKVVAYHNCAGPRFAHWVRTIATTLFADVRTPQVYGLLLRLLDLDEVELDRLPQQGFSAEYVRRETTRAVRSVGPATRIYTGVDIDIPVGSPPEAVADRAKRSESVTGLHAEPTTDSDLASGTPEGVRDAVTAAFDGGAAGVVLSRKYSEMRLANLTGAGDAVRARRR